MRFADKQRAGQQGESLIGAWLRSRGNWVLPTYEVALDAAKGPRLFGPGGGDLISPDLLVMGPGGVLWVEAKQKTAFSWHRLTRRWVTGIDLRHYRDYLRVQAETPFDVWLLFLHTQGQTPDGACPTGLFGGALDELRSRESHRSGNWGSGGMVYWAHEALRLLATLEDVEAAAGGVAAGEPSHGAYVWAAPRSETR